MNEQDDDQQTPERCDYCEMPAVCKVQLSEALNADVCAEHLAQALERLEQRERAGLTNA